MFVFLSWWVTFTPFRLCLRGYIFLWLACECPYSVQYFIATSTHELNSSLQTGSNVTFLANAFHSAVILLVLVLSLVLYSCSRWTEFSTVSGVSMQWPVVLLHHLCFLGLLHLQTLIFAFISELLQLWFINANEYDVGSGKTTETVSILKPLVSEIVFSQYAFDCSY